MAPNTRRASLHFFPSPVQRAKRTADSQINDASATTQIPEIEPIAIIGMGCRLPGGCDAPWKLWELLIQERSTQSSIPKSRFNADAFYHPNLERPGSITTAGGYFLDEDIRAFDNEFFGIHNLEAAYMDPEQRKLLEVVFECFESAGTTLEAVSGANVGCYVGKFTYDYLIMQNKDPESLHRYSATGMSNTILANRISHVFNLVGPSLVLDTACSSSLYCLHMACNALRAGDCDSAIVAAANLIQSPEQYIATMKAGVLSPTGASHTFDAAADGYGRGESVGALYIKKLSKAIEDGDRIRSVIRGTAVNSNGRTPGITLPSTVRQEEVIRKAYKVANLSLDNTDYVECHGTGTPVGDPIEVEALSRVFQNSRGPLLVGSVKPSVGHSEAASAITSIIKVTLALEKGEIPATFGVTNVNPNIKAEEWNVKIVTKHTPWPNNSGDGIRRASVNSFGFGGANAHAILEAAESHVPLGYHASDGVMTSARTKYLLPFSASSHSSLESRVEDLTTVCHQGVSVLDLAHTLGTCRSKFRSRGYLLACQRNLRDDLELQNLCTNKDLSGPFPRILALVFTGQGAQWPQMGLDLMQEFPSFRHTIQRLDKFLQSMSNPPSWTMHEILSEVPETSRVRQAVYSQPLCTAIQIALVQLLVNWGFQPNYVVGHSSGEICAAYTAGFITAEQAILIAYYRGYACSGLTLHGAMLAVGCSDQEAMMAIQALNLTEIVQVACINSPKNVTLSGDRAGITQLRSHFTALDIFARELKTDGKAYHSKHMVTVGQDYEDILIAATESCSVAPESKQPARWISTVTGDYQDAYDGLRYWRDNLESPVLFSKAIGGILEESDVHFIEVGPHPVLDLPIQQIVASLKVDRSRSQYSSTLTRGHSGVDCILKLIGHLYLRDHDISFPRVNSMELPLSTSAEYQSQGKAMANLPNYRWKYEVPLWRESRYSSEFCGREYPRHDILGSRLPGMGETVAIWRNILRARDVAWLKDHRVDGQIVFPAAGYIAMAIEAACQLIHGKSSSLPACHLENIAIIKALVFSEEESAPDLELHTMLRPILPSSRKNLPKMWHFSISSSPTAASIMHAEGEIGFELGTQDSRKKLSVQSDDLERQSAQNWYDRMSQAGLNLSGDFRALYEVYNARKRQSQYTVATIPFNQPRESAFQSTYALHPSTMDGILHAGLIATAAGIIKDFQLRLPVSIGSMRIALPTDLAADEMLVIHAYAEPVGMDSMKSSLEVHSQHHETILEIENCRLKVPFHNQRISAPERHPILRVAWKADINRLDGTTSSSFASLTGSPPFNPALHENANFTRLVTVLDLLVHKSPGLRILNVQHHDVHNHKVLLQYLQYNTAFKRCQSFARATDWDERGMYVEKASVTSTGDYDFGKSSAAKAASYDLLLYSGYSEFDLPLDHIKRVLVPAGTLVGNLNTSQINALNEGGFSITYLDGSTLPATILARRVEAAVGNEAISLNLTDNEGGNREIVLVERNCHHEFNSSLEACLAKRFRRSVKRFPFSELGLHSFSPGSIVISTLELEEPLFPTISDEQLSQVNMITQSSSNLLWITGGGLLSGSRPDFAITYGLSRALMLEQPATKFLMLDIDDVSQQVANTLDNALYVLLQGLNSITPDYEYIQHQGILHVSRFVPDIILNANFRQKQGFEMLSSSLQAVKPCQLLFETPRQVESAFYKQLDADTQDLGFDDVEIDVEFADLDSRSASILNGKVETEYSGALLQLTGIVTQVGQGVTNLAIGDRTTALIPGKMKSLVRAPEWACIKLQEDQDGYSHTPMLAADSTALYALRNCGKPSAGDSVLMVPGASNVGISAILTLGATGTEVFATASTLPEQDFLLNQLHMRRDHIFDLTDPMVANTMLEITEKQGFDLVVNTSDHALPPILWDLCAACGHIVETCYQTFEKDYSISPKLPNRGISHTVFDLHDVFNLKTVKSQRTWASLIEQSTEISRTSTRSIIPTETFDAGSLVEAFYWLESGIGIGKATISFRCPQSPIRALPSKYDTSFSPSKTYLLVGCLGGLGRSLSKWMRSRGAARFVYLNKSGLDRSVASDFVSDLRNTGADVTIVRGDVCSFADVVHAVGKIQSPLGGVVQAAMGLDASLFASMSSRQWNTAVMPKVLGTWNIHNAIKGLKDELDFFLMTSSVSGSIGVATEANYCAANYFLDVFARYRLSIGLPAVSIGIGMMSQIGYLHEHPDIQHSLAQKGVSALDEDDFLQIVDAALVSSSAGHAEHNYGNFSRGHILTGLEPSGLNELRKSGFEGTPATFDDPRAAVINDALQGAGKKGTSVLTAGLPVEVVDAFHNGDSVHDAALSLIARQFSNFLLTPLDKLDTSKPLAGFGMDSVLAAAVRAWLYRQFQVDIAFMTLLSQTASIKDLVETITESVIHQMELKSG